MSRASWLLTCSPCAGLASLAALTTGLLILGYAWSSFLRGAAYGYDDPYSPDAADAASTAPPAPVPRRGAGYPPVLAYYISGGHGDSVRMTRLLKAVYHPRNRYLLHLDAGAPRGGGGRESVGLAPPSAPPPTRSSISVAL